MPKSALAAPGDRPEPAHHYESLCVTSDLLEQPHRITLVDDFITKGATLLAAASRVKESFPRAEVRAFALVRTMGLVPEIDTIVAPCMGRITFDGSSIRREP